MDTSIVRHDLKTARKDIDFGFSGIMSSTSMWEYLNEGKKLQQTPVPDTINISIASSDLWPDMTEAKVTHRVTNELLYVMDVSDNPSISAQEVWDDYRSCQFAERLRRLMVLPPKKYNVDGTVCNYEQSESMHPLNFPAWSKKPEKVKEKKASKPRPKKESEAWVRNKLKAKEGGNVEVSCECGRVDLVTDTEVIEVKSIDGWKGAIGQAIAYSTYFPSHKPRIHLFGYAPNERKALIQDHCTAAGVAVSYHEPES